MVDEGNDLRNDWPNAYSKLSYNAHQQQSDQKIGYATLPREARQCVCTFCTNAAVAVSEQGDNLRNGRLNGLSKFSYKACQRLSDQKIVYSTLFREYRQCICTCFTKVPVAVIEESDDLRNGRPNGLLELSYNAHQQCSDQKTEYYTLLREVRQCISTCSTNIVVAITEEGDNLRNGRLNGLSKLSYMGHQWHSDEKNCIFYLVLTVSTMHLYPLHERCSRCH